MKKRILSVIISVLMILPIIPIVTSGEGLNDTFSSNWSVSSGKWQSSDSYEHIGDYVNTSGGSKCTVTPTGGIRCTAPTNEEAPGAMSAQSLTTLNRCTLDGLELRLSFDDFKMSRLVNLSSGIQMLWCTEKAGGEVDGIRSVYSEYCVGEDQAFNIGKYGLRNIVPKGSKALAVSIRNAELSPDHKGGDGTCLANCVQITYYDGSDEWWKTGEYADGCNTGMTWTFVKRTGDSDPSAFSNIDFSEGLTIRVTSDDEHGYIVSLVDVNGKQQFYSKDKAAYYPVPVKQDYAEPTDVDLTGLVGLEGYLTVGTNAAMPDDPNVFTLESVNGDGAVAFNGCAHKPDGEVLTEYIHPCSAGSSCRICSVCGGMCDIAEAAPAADHTPGEWITVEEATVISNGRRIRTCTECGEVVETGDIEKLPNPFSDVSDDEWFTEAAFYCYSNGYMYLTDMEAKTFSPAWKLTRAQMVQILAQVAKVDLEKYTPSGRFSDVPADAWYAAAVEWAADCGVTYGTGNGMFSPSDTVDREQLAVFLKAFANMLGYRTTASVEIDGYADRDDISGWAVEGIKWVVAENIMTGTTETTISPKAKTTRAETAVIIMMFDKLLGRVPGHNDV